MSSRKRSVNQVIDLNKPHTCEFCKHTFAKEHTLIQHVCEPKRRHQSRDLPDVKQAFVCYQILHACLNPRLKNEPRTYAEFSQSGMYTQLVKFVNWCTEQEAQEINQFVKWLCDHNHMMHAWCDRIKYDQFLKELTQTEPVEQALCRSLKHIQAWHEASGHAIQEFFERAHVSQICRWITQGKISGWLLYNASSAVKFLERCSPEQLQIVQEHVPITFWKVKFLRQSDQAHVVQITLTEAGL